MGEQRMRIVAGTHKGRRIDAPKGGTTRPTSDRVREAMFSSIVSAMGSLQGQRVLDLYAGSGALGLEALSRGAESAVFVDSAKPAVASVRGNLAALKLEDRGTVLGVPVKAAHRLIPGGSPFSLLFADPPYRISKSEVRASIESLAADDLIARDALFVWEHASGETPDWPTGFSVTGTKKYGSTQVTFARYDPPKEA